MKDEDNSLLLEIRELLENVLESQQKLRNEVIELKEGQKKIYNEIRLNNLVLNNITARNEILN